VTRNFKELEARMPKENLARAEARAKEILDGYIKQNIIIQPKKEPDEYDLASLVQKITDENLHAEIDTGKPVGNETC
jgi:antitoxin component of MazEF toxin-antitoxin module